jgi:hypothetical protein
MANWKKKLLAVVGGLAIAGLLLELGLRLLGIGFPNFYKPDTVLGFAHRPGARGWWRAEGRAYVEINQNGERDREHAWTKPPGTFRIAVLGDSYAEAFQVPLDKTFWAVLERALGDCRALEGRKVEVLNFGVSAYGTTQELLVLRQRVWDYSPDLVLLAFFTGNDVSDNSRALRASDEVPYFVLRDGKLVFDTAYLRTPSQTNAPTWPREVLRQVIDRSYLLQLVRQAWGVALKGKASQTDPTGASMTAELTESFYQNPIYREPDDPKWRDAWQVTERLLVEMQRAATRKGIPFLVVTLSNGVQVHPDPSIRENLQKRLGVPDLFYPDRRIQDFGRTEGFPVLNLAPAMRSYAEQNRVFLHGFGSAKGTGHWNEGGHRLAGDLIASWICEELSTDLPKKEGQAQGTEGVPSGGESRSP